jgi:adenylate cyclase
VSDEPQETPSPGEAGEQTAGGKRATARMRRIDSSEGAVRVAKALRKLLPGDAEYGDRLSTGGEEPAQQLGQRVAAITAERPSALREVGLSALQVWQAFSDAPGGSETYSEVAILFTDLVDFSRWALGAGDEAAVKLLRQVGEATEPPIELAGGHVVKRLGDGLMAVFDAPQGAVEGALAASASLRDIEVAGYRPKLRAGVHYGRAQRVGSDYLGVDVNVAARVAAAAGPGDVLISETARERLDISSLRLRRKWLFRAKGAPEDLKVFSVQARS